MRQELISWATIILSFFAFLSFPPPAFAATVVINEFLANPSSGQGEWVELYNPTGSDVILVGWKLVDGSNSTKTLDSLGTILANGFLIYEYASDGWMNNTASTSKPETITLKDSSDSSVDSYSYTVDQKENVTTGRSPDGTGEFVVLALATKGFTNGAAPTPTFTPTPTQTQPTPTKTPTPTPTSKPTPIKSGLTATAKVTQTPTATSIPTIKTSFSPTPEPEIEDNAPTSILGEMATASPSASPTIADAKKASFFDLPKLFIGAGFVFLAGSGILAFRRFHEKDNFN